MPSIRKLTEGEGGGGEEEEGEGGWGEKFSIVILSF